MKKIVITGLAAVLVLCIAATSAFAAGGWGGRSACRTSGICLSGQAASVCTQENCPNAGQSCPAGNSCSLGGYTDQDGDGVCDHYGDSCRSQQHHGGHHGGRS